MPPATDLSNLVVVLVRPRNPLNIGAVARAMTNFGASQLRLVTPYAVAFREAQSAVNAQDLLRQAEEFNHVADAVADCSLVVGTTAVRNRALQHPLHRLDGSGGAVIRKQIKRHRVALLFGSEKIGLTNEDFSHCHWLMHIPTEPQHISMNLAQSVAVCLYGIATPRTGSRPQSRSGTAKPASKPATAGQTEQIVRLLLEGLRISDYIKPGTDAVCEKKVRRLLLRLHIDQLDADVLLGMVRQMVWKLRKSEPPKR